MEVEPVLNTIHVLKIKPDSHEVNDSHEGNDPFPTYIEDLRIWVGSSRGHNLSGPT